MERKKKSQTIEDFLNLIDACNRQYEVGYAKVGEANKLVVDLLHKLELNPPSEKDKTATLLRNACKDRRYWKDMEEEAQCTQEWFENYKSAVEQLKQTLGKLRKVEEYHNGRSYHPRILKDEE